ncbi:MAG: MiaB/RimO family radical SAM methylthiotransferase [Spirochaetes bacterium]|nr:MiaB/RimO family radical SAM methylthiotransferase [Spirochaetota bacterium]
MNKKSASEMSFHIETLGCPKNRVDSRRMRTSLLNLGYNEAKKPEAADIFLINSCSFIREAQEETISTVFDALKIKEKKSPHMKVGLVGCFVERFSDAVKNDIPELDFTIGTQRYHEVGGLISEKFSVETAGHAANLAAASINADSHKPFAWLRIAQGCNRSCAFCIIPKIRGELKTYPVDSIEKQWADELALRGAHGTPVREVVLVSQDTISQGVEEIERIVAQLSAKDEIEWIRLQYLFPDRRVLDLLDLWAKYPKLTPYLDIPFQHVSPEILKAMKRPSDTGLFREIIDRAHAITPDFEIRTSFIVGFPGEEEKHFADLEKFIAGHRIDKLALFRYSHEAGTYAGDKLQENTSDEEKYRRINQLREAHLETRKQYATGLIGRREKMLVDEIAGGEITLRRAHDAPESDEVVTIPLPYRASGRSQDDLASAASPATACRVGDMPLVELKAYTEYSFLGEIV